MGDPSRRRTKKTDAIEFVDCCPRATTVDAATAPLQRPMTSRRVTIIVASEHAGRHHEVSVAQHQHITRPDHGAMMRGTAEFACGLSKRTEVWL